MKKLHSYKVHGRMKINYEYEIKVAASSEDDAVIKAEQHIYAKLGINQYDVVDDEIYVERIKEMTAK